MVNRKSSSKPKLVAVTADRERPLSSTRRKVAQHATWQLESILEGITAIARDVNNVDPDVQGQLLALAMRASDVNSAAMSAIGAGDDDADDAVVIDLVATLNSAELDYLRKEVANG